MCVGVEKRDQPQQCNALHGQNEADLAHLRLVPWHAVNLDRPQCLFFVPARPVSRQRLEAARVEAVARNTTSTAGLLVPLCRIVRTKALPRKRIDKTAAP